MKWIQLDGNQRKKVWLDVEVRKATWTVDARFNAAAESKLC